MKDSLTKIARHSRGSSLESVTLANSSHLRVRRVLLHAQDEGLGKASRVSYFFPVSSRIKSTSA
jgi:hypothetical protein